MRKSIICTCKCEVCHYSLLLVWRFLIRSYWAHRRGKIVMC
jgi:hypothetical protein